MSGLVEKAGFSADLRSRLTGGFLLNLVGAACNQGSTLAVNVLVSNLYGPKVFGEYAAIQATIATGAAIASFGTGYTTTKYVAELRSADPQRASRVLGLCAGVACVTALIMTAILFGGASWIAERSLHASRLAPALRIASCAIFFNVLNWYLMGGLSGLEAYRSLARAGVVSGAAYLVLCSLGTWLGGLEGTLAGVALSAAFQTLVLLAFLTREARNQGLRIQLADAWTERNVLWRFAVPSALPGFTTMPAIWIANLVLLRQPDGYAQLGFYSAAYNFRTMTVFLPSVLASVSMAVLNNQIRAGEANRYWAVFRLSIAMTGVVTLAVALFFALTGRPLLRIFGPSYDRAYIPLLILLAGSIVEATWTIVAQVLSSRERMWSLLLFCTFPRDALLVVLAFVFVPRLESTGLALAYALSWIVGLVLAVGIARQSGSLSSQSSPSRATRIPKGEEKNA